MLMLATTGSARDLAMIAVEGVIAAQGIVAFTGFVMLHVVFLYRAYKRRAG